MTNCGSKCCDLFQASGSGARWKKMRGNKILLQLSTLSHCLAYTSQGSACLIIVMIFIFSPHFLSVCRASPATSSRYSLRASPLRAWLPLSVTSFFPPVFPMRSLYSLIEHNVATDPALSLFVLSLFVCYTRAVFFNNLV